MGGVADDERRAGVNDGGKRPDGRLAVDGNRIKVDLPVALYRTRLVSLWDRSLYDCIIHTFSVTGAYVIAPVY